MSEDFDELYDESEELDAHEAYCMICKQKTQMENPEAIWTRRGAPGTRGTCSVCGTVVFRMGRTREHDMMKRPEPVQVVETPRGKAHRKSNAVVTYINYSIPDAEFAKTLSQDLNKIGIQTWLAEINPSDVNWATGVHPALVECRQMIVVLSPLAARATDVTDAWKLYLENRKPIYVAQVQAVDVPDELRSKPRVDFSDDYKRAFRQLVQAING